MNNWFIFEGMLALRIPCPSCGDINFCYFGSRDIADRLQCSRCDTLYIAVLIVTIEEDTDEMVVPGD